MDRKERDILAAKLNQKAKKAFDKVSRVLPELTVGDRMRIQNLMIVRKMKWDRTGVITDIMRDRQYSMLVNGSCC